ncbi:hypothetical protein GCM10023319_46670 [Nocardia iowensis]
MSDRENVCRTRQTRIGDSDAVRAGAPMVGDTGTEPIGYAAVVDTPVCAEWDEYPRGSGDFASVSRSR